VTADSMPAEVGDEPLLLARRSGVPVWVGRDRAAAGQALLAAFPAVDVLLCDDGLQHYRLARDVELAVFDGRGAGNGCLLPAGPLRESLTRLREVDAVICNGAADHRLPDDLRQFEMRLRPTDFYRLDQPGQACQAAQLAGRRLHALAGIGDPGRFFRTLEGLGLSFSRHPFADHHAYTAADLAFATDGVLLMTEKDAVKCSAIVPGETWVLPVEAELSPALVELILEKIRGRQVA
jgi:tetraacyldisaccharide 4'-kinase